MATTVCRHGFSFVGGKVANLMWRGILGTLVLSMQRWLLCDDRRDYLLSYVSRPRSCCWPCPLTMHAPVPVYADDDDDDVPPLVPLNKPVAPTTSSAKPATAAKPAPAAKAPAAAAPKSTPAAGAVR